MQQDSRAEWERGDAVEDACMLEERAVEREQRDYFNDATVNFAYQRPLRSCLLLYNSCLLEFWLDRLLL